MRADPAVLRAGALQERYADRGFSVLGFPCNQFAGQEPGTAEEIATFCSATYGVSFPLFEKTDVNGADRHPLYERLTSHADAEGAAGEVQWNFEKFLVGRQGEVVGRFRPRTEPEADEVSPPSRPPCPPDPRPATGPARVPDRPGSGTARRRAGRHPTAVPAMSVTPTITPARPGARSGTARRAARRASATT